MQVNVTFNVFPVPLYLSFKREVDSMIFLKIFDLLKEKEKGEREILFFLL